MSLSAFDLFSIGVGPSSSHTVGPMRAGKRFVDHLGRDLPRVSRVHVELFGSLGATGHGHGSEKAVILGLEGEDPATVDTSDHRVDMIGATHRLRLGGEVEIGFDASADLVLHRTKSLPAHPNGMVFTAHDADGVVVAQRTYYSVGGGFVVDESAVGIDRVVADVTPVVFPFTSATELLATCARESLTISDVVMANELSWRTADEVRRGLLHLWEVMRECIERGYVREGNLPGGLRVPRRAPGLHRDLLARCDEDPLHVMDWVNLFALAVNEENASGGRIVTAPTNGAAGIIPAVLSYYTTFVVGANDEGVVRFLMAATAIGILFKENASISGAEVGCQGEVGSACAMAAAGLCEVLGGTPGQVENAAEIGIEHNEAFSPGAGRGAGVTGVTCGFGVS